MIPNAFILSFITNIYTAPPSWQLLKRAPDPSMAKQCIFRQSSPCPWLNRAPGTRRSGTYHSAITYHPDVTTQRRMRCMLGSTD